MTDHIDPVRSNTIIPDKNRDDISRRQKTDSDHGQAKGDRDRISLDSSNKSGATYGPQAGLEIGSPYQLLRSLVVKVLQDQGTAFKVSTGDFEINFKTMTSNEAQELIADDGYFGVEQTSDRIVDFAINAFGNDPTKLQQMKDAIEKGFSEAQQAFGGTLPEISQKTHDAIMEKLDAFALQSDESREE